MINRSTPPSDTASQQQQPIDIPKEKDDDREQMIEASRGNVQNNVAISPPIGGGRYSRFGIFSGGEATTTTEVNMSMSLATSTTEANIKSS